jgi:hypothetical protein
VKNCVEFLEVRGDAVVAHFAEGEVIGYIHLVVHLTFNVVQRYAMLSKLILVGKVPEIEFKSSITFI